MVREDGHSWGEDLSINIKLSDHLEKSVREDV